MIASKHVLDRLAAVPVEQLAQAPRAHQAGRALGVEVPGERVGHPGVAGHDAQRRLVGHALVPQLDRRDHQPLLEHAARVRAASSRAPTPPMSSWWPNACTNATTSPSVEDRDGDAQVGQVADAALGQVDVVVEEDVAGLHRLDREVADDRLDQRRVGAAGQLAQPYVVDARAEVVRVADHRRAGGARDGGLDLLLHRGERALDDLHQHRVDAPIVLIGVTTTDCRNSSTRRREAGVDRQRRAVLLDHRRARATASPAPRRPRRWIGVSRPHSS